MKVPRETCQRCNLAHAPGPEAGSIDFEASPEAHEFPGGASCIEAQALAMRTLLERCFQPDTCRGCQAPIFWVLHRNGKRVPYTPAGLNHFIDCPEAAKFKK